jgi:hypothetical protein
VPTEDFEQEPDKIPLVPSIACLAVLRTDLKEKSMETQGNPSRGYGNPRQEMTVVWIGWIEMEVMRSGWILGTF